MEFDACSIVGDLLPLYADDLLSPESRRFVEEHATRCANCGAQLQALERPTPPPPPLELDEAGRRLVPRVRRLVISAMAGLLAVLVAVSGLSYLMGRATRSIASDQTPLRVKSAAELAAKVIPGWSRAVEQGFVVPLGLTQRVPGTEAWITLEQGWFSDRQSYLVYTVKAPKGKHVLPSFGYLTRADGEVIYDGDVDWTHLNRWGGFSGEGHHGVMVLDRRQPPPDGGTVTLTVRQWLPVSPRGASDQQVGEELSLTIPWQAAYTQAPAPAVIPLNQAQTWLGRTLTLEELRVGTGSMQLTGLIDLPEGESNPGLHGWFLVGGQERSMRGFRREKIGEPNRYRFTAEFDGPDRWPAHVELRVKGIGFETNQTLVWSINWAKYRMQTESKPMDEQDRVAVRFYDSTLISWVTTEQGVSIMADPPAGKPPYVQAQLRGGGRGVEGAALHPGFEVANEAGDRMTNMGGGGGSDGVRERTSALWRKGLPDALRQSDRLILRYVNPEAEMVLDETWVLVAE